MSKNSQINWIARKAEQNIVHGPALKEHICAHAVLAGSNKHLYRVTKEMHVFKSAIWAPEHLRSSNYDLTFFGQKVIVNMMIPVSTLIVVDTTAFIAKEKIPLSRMDMRSYRKMRAANAIVHSIANSATGKLLPIAWSSAPSNGYLQNFQRMVYYPGGLAVPSKRFDQSREQCSAGIHFFVNLHDALEW